MSRNGLRIIPDLPRTDWPEEWRGPAFSDRTPSDALDHTLDAIAARYGVRTRNVVAMQLEYPG